MPNYAKLLIETALTERTKFSRVGQILRGVDPKIDSYGLLTAENPFGEKHGPEENREYDKELEQELRTRGYGFYKVKGKFFGNTERSYLIPKLSEKDAIEFGKTFGQESVIQGEKKMIDGEPQMVHKYIVGDKVMQTRKTFGQLAKDVEDMYSTIQGRKFKIPFFDPEQRGKKFVGGKVVSGGGDDIEREEQPFRDTEKSDFTKGKTKLINTNGHEVWVKQENEPHYLKQGYKKHKAA